MGIERSEDFERIVDNTTHVEDSEEQAIEQSLRPTNFDEYIGQERLKNNLKLAIEAVKKRRAEYSVRRFLLMLSIILPKKSGESFSVFA